MSQVRTLWVSIIFGALASLALFLPNDAFAQVAWNATDYTLYDTITIDATNIDATLTDFPVYVDLSDLSSNFWATTPTGSTTVATDIRITTNAGSPVELARELVSASSSLQTGELHFKADSISSTTDTVFRVYYNGTTTGDYASTTTYGSQNVWSDYDFVAHDGGLTDSGPNSIVPVDDGTEAAATTQLGDGGRTFVEGNTDIITIDDDSTFEQETGTINFSAWIYKDAGGTGPDIIFEEGGGTNGFTVLYDTSADQYSIVMANDGSPEQFVQTGTIIEGQYNYLVFQFNNGTTSIYVNGVLNDTDTFSSTTLNAHGNPAGLGGNNSGNVSNLLGSPGNSFDGSLDEVRRYGEGSGVVLSAAWIKAEYLNQATTTDFYTVVESPVSISGTLYENDGITPITTGKTVTAVVGTASTTLYSTTTDASGDFIINNIDNSTIGTWTNGSSAGRSWQGVAYGNGLFVAVGDANYSFTGSDDPLMTSPDGIDWTVRDVAGGDDFWFGVTYGNGRFVAVGSGGPATNDRVMYSDDGITWATTTAAGDDDSWQGVAYGNGLFVAVGGSSDLVMTSPDGITWTARTAAGDNDKWQGITYGNGQFVAVANNNAGTADVVMSSPDGVSWSTSTVPDSGQIDLRAVTIADGKFVTVGEYIFDFATSLYADAGFGDTTPITLYIDGETEDATTLTYGPNGTTTITGIDLYQDTVRFQHSSTSGDFITHNGQFEDFYDAEDDADILFTATSSATSTFAYDVEIATNTTFYPRANLDLQNDLAINGTFANEQGEVFLTGGDQTLTTSATTIFYEFTAATSTARTLTFQSGEEYVFLATTTISGADGELTSLDASTPGSEYFFRPYATPTVSYLDVQDNFNISATTTNIDCSATCVDGGNTSGWSLLAAPASVWNATDYTLYDTITIDATNIDATLTDFPVYVDLSDLSSNFWATTPTGSTTVATDIRITTNAGSPVELARELVSASSSLQTGELHFKADSISSTTDTTFRIYYNGTTTGDYATDATYGAENVWTNNFVAVYHFEEAVNNDAGGYMDSTVNGFNGTGTSMSLTDTSDKVSGNAAAFDGESDYINLGTQIDLASLPALTTSAWVNYDSSGTNEHTILSSWENSLDQASVLFRIEPADDTLEGFVYDGTQVGGTLTGTSIAPNEWGYAVMRLDSTGDGIDGFSNETESSNNFASGAFNSSASPDMYIGETPHILTDGFTGSIDEVRIASSSRSNAWISAEHLNQATTTDFYTSQQYVAGAWNSDDWTNNIELTIASTSIDAALTDFPVYVDLGDFSNAFWDNVTESCGDVRVMNSDLTVELPREVVSCDTSAKTGELHFKADSLSSTTANTFYIYFNASDADYATDATYGAENVWSNGYVAVYHLGEDGNTDAGGYRDSTSFGNHGTGTSMTSGSDVAGRLGLAQDLDGASDYIEIPSTSEFDFSASDYAVSLWVDMDASQNSFAALYSKGNGVGNDWSFQRRSTTNDTAIFHTSGTGNFITNGWSTIAGAGWKHVTLQFDTSANDADEYIDGSFFDSNDAVNSKPDFETDRPVRLGAERSAVGNLDGSLDEVRISNSIRTLAWISAEYLNQSTTTDFYSFAGAGSITIADNAGGQADNAFSFKNVTEASGYSFQLTPAGETATVTAVTLSVNGISDDVEVSSIDSIQLLRDNDNDAEYDITDTVLDATGVFSFSGQSGTITFDADFLATTTTDYLVIFDTNDIDRGEALVVDLEPSGVTSIGVTTGSAMTVSGGVSSVQHIRANKGGGGGGSQGSIGGDAPEGRSVETGGEEDGGDEVGAVEDGDDIVADSAFAPPSETGSSFDNITNPTNAYVSDGTDATAASTQKQSYGNFGFSIPGGNEITGITVKVDVSATDGAGSSADITLSHDGGTSETASQATGGLTTSDVVYVLGGPGDLWGRSWSPSEFNDGNFEVIIQANPGDVGTLELDAIQVRIYHQTTGGGGGGGGAI